MQYFYRLVQIKQPVLQTKPSIWRYLFVLIMLSVACRWVERTGPEDGTTEEVADLTPLMIQVEDMGWSSGYYHVDKEFDSLPPLGPTSPREVWHVIISPIPGTGGGKYPLRHDDIRSGSQTVSLFKDEETAQKEFEAITERPLLLSAGGWTLYEGPLDDRIDNMFARCHHFDTSGYGWLEECNAQMQLGSYLVEFGIVIDGDLVTRQDWVNMIEIVQKRLIEHVVQDSQSV